MTLEFSDLIGEEIHPFIDSLAELRLTVFREYPYLYDGTLDYEQAYLKKLAASPHGYVVLAKDGDTVVGACTALPLSDADAQFQKPFIDQGLDPEDYFYFGESVLLPAYRGQGAGRKFFEEREAQAHFLAFPFSCFCAVVRPEGHPSCPEDYQSHERMWSKRNFKRRPDLTTTFAWKDLEEAQETEKQMEFWVRREEAEF